MSKRNFNILVSAILVLFGYSIGYFQENNTYSSRATPEPTMANSSVLSGNDVLYRVTKVIDGDTIQIEGNVKVRYIGIDTPETVDPKRKDACFGKEAANRNKELVEGKKVRLEKDVSETDSFGRLLRYVYVVEADKIDEVMINDELVRNGYAKVSTFPPDVRYTEKLLESEKYARENKLGLWGMCE